MEGEDLPRWASLLNEIPGQNWWTRCTFRTRAPLAIPPPPSTADGIFFCGQTHSMCVMGGRRNWAVKPSDFAHQIRMTSSFEHLSESTTCEASSERQRCSPSQPITWCHSYLVAEKRQSHFSEQLSHTQTLTLGSPLRSSHALDTDRGSVSAHQPAVRIDSLPPL